MADVITFDADNHYYEPRDCFTRHIESKFVDLALRPVSTEEGKETIALGDFVLHFPNTHYDEAARPGAFQALLVDEELSDEQVAAARHQEPLQPEFVEKSARVKLMESQGLDRALFLPTLGFCWEYEARRNIQALYANLRSFNRWLEDDWGYGADGKVIGIPIISLFDVQEAVDETRRLLGLGAKCLALRPGPVLGRSIADPVFDPFWALVTEAHLPVAFHIGDTGYNDLMSAQWGEDPAPNVTKMSPFQLGLFFCDRPIMDTLGACILQNLFGRFPDLNLLVLEHGCAWVEYLLHAIDHGAKICPWLGGNIDGQRPSDIFRQHIKVAPFPEEDVLHLVDLLGPENVLFGSDFPHPEGISQPLAFADSISSLETRSIQMIMGGNIEKIIQRVG